MILALFLLRAGNHATGDMLIRMGRTFRPPWGGWLLSLALVVVAGLAFGLAAILPEHARYRPTRALLLGAIPLLMLVHMTIYFGPPSSFLAEHLRFLVPLFGRRDFFFDGIGEGFSAVPILLGVAIAAGFAPG